ncbi:hypothetical protein QFZ76_009328 [Streptomyces sp. V4I2]|nr:hypothetical protein [Streptomyces sp. V4I2]
MGSSRQDDGHRRSDDRDRSQRDHHRPHRRHSSACAGRGGSPGGTSQGAGERFPCAAGTGRARASASRSCPHHTQLSTSWTAGRASGSGSGQLPKASIPLQRPTTARRSPHHPFAVSATLSRTPHEGLTLRDSPVPLSRGASRSIARDEARPARRCAATSPSGRSLGRQSESASRARMLSARTPRGVLDEVAVHPVAATSTPPRRRERLPAQRVTSRYSPVLRRFLAAAQGSRHAVGGSGAMAS